jgi:hypothetical protein
MPEIAFLHQHHSSMLILICPLLADLGRSGLSVAEHAAVWLRIAGCRRGKVMERYD